MDIVIERNDESLWVAATERGRLYGLEIDPPGEAVRWGSIYWAKVARLDKAQDAAFIDLGGGQEGILYNRDVRLKQKDDSIHKGGAESITKALSPGQMITVQAKSGYLRQEDTFEFLREDKVPRLSMDITLQGRFLIFAPLMRANKISSRLRDPALRAQLTAMMEGFDMDGGLILRASSEDTQRDILFREAKILHEQWQAMIPHFKGSKPFCVEEGADAVRRTLGDQAFSQIERIETLSEDVYKAVESWCNQFAPDLAPKITLADVETPDDTLALFDHRGLIGDIEDLFQEYGLLPGGGSIIVQETAALTAIDVNRGGDDRAVMDVNIEAASEIARQIRLRNLGGIILIDFLKFPKKSDQTRFLKAVEPIFDTDPCTVQIHGLGPLGLLEITRKRRTPPLRERLDMMDEFKPG